MCKKNLVGEKFVKCKLTSCWVPYKGEGSVECMDWSFQRQFWKEKNAPEKGIAR